jgi:hypothetical protein
MLSCLALGGLLVVLALWWLQRAGKKQTVLMPLLDQKADAATHLKSDASLISQSPLGTQNAHALSTHQDHRAPSSAAKFVEYIRP